MAAAQQREGSSNDEINKVSALAEGAKGGSAMQTNVILMKDVRAKLARQNTVVAEIALQKYLKELANWMEETRVTKPSRAEPPAIRAISQESGGG